MATRRLVVRGDLQRPAPASSRFFLFPATEIQGTQLVVDVRAKLGGKLHRPAVRVERLGESSCPKMEVAEILGELWQVRRVLEPMLHRAQGIVIIAVTLERRGKIVREDSRLGMSGESFGEEGDRPPKIATHARSERRIVE